MWRGKKTGAVIGILLCALFLLFLLSAGIGRFAITPAQVAELVRERLTGQPFFSESAGTVLFGTRIPRICTAMLIGCALSVSGASYQGIFRNPMVSPDLLGAAAGAGFGASLGFLFGLSTILTELLAFGSGLAAVSIALLISRFVGDRFDTSPVLLVLCGIVVGALFEAFISIVKYVADPFDTMPSIAFWLMGGLTYVTAVDVWFLLVPVAAGCVILLLLRWKINLLSFGGDEAESLGVAVRRCQVIIIICATFMTAASVAVGGMIGWVGLVVPHFARILAGPDYRKMLPCAAILGAGFLLIVDDAARCLFGQELPIGILTAIIGAPVFISLLAKGRKGFVG